MSHVGMVCLRGSRVLGREIVSMATHPCVVCQSAPACSAPDRNRVMGSITRGTGTWGPRTDTYHMATRLRGVVEHVPAFFMLGGVLAANNSTASSALESLGARSGSFDASKSFDTVVEWEEMPNAHAVLSRCSRFLARRVATCPISRLLATYHGIFVGRSAAAVDT